MTLNPGTQLGPYEILSAIGAGGMGEVYRARDPRVGREVAIKVSTEKFSERFEREARAVAALNHPNICTLHDVGPDYIVMELVEGETLADRIQQGAIPLDEALQIARQIADALEAAHEKGIIHRDLKPGNIKIRPDGTVKVLDFGLAKVTETQDASLSHSPTLSHLATQQGIILGTAGYMSPEQARGKTVDKRTDIWAFGVVLYEMLTGMRLFDGDTVSDTLAAVLKEEPDWKKIPAKVLPLLRRCLERDPKQRLRDIGDAMSFFGVMPESVAERRLWLPWSIAAVLLVALAIGAVAVSRRPPQAAKTIRFLVSLPEPWYLTQILSVGAASPIAVSPDGQQIAFIASADNTSRLWVRSLSDETPRMLAGTEGAWSPFWSPDSRFIAFFEGTRLKKIEVSGGPAVTLCDAPAKSRGGTWNAEGMIVFGQADGPLQKVSASGGVASPASKVSPGEEGHWRPIFLPDGRHFLYRAVGTTGPAGPIWLGSLDSDARTLLLNADSVNVGYSQGHVLFLRDTTLMAQPFDTARLVLSGEAFPIAEQIQTQASRSSPLGVFSASENGVLAYQSGFPRTGSRLVWFDRSGKEIGLLGEAADYTDLELSPDGKRLAVGIAEKAPNIWLFDLASGLRTRFTFEPGGNAADTELRSSRTTPIWSPDGGRIAFSLPRKGQLNIYQKDSTGAGQEEVLLESPVSKAINCWSPDGRFILYTAAARDIGTDLYVLPLFGDRKPFPFLNNPKVDEGNGRFSPDGRWVSYRSNESGQDEIYVAPFPGPGGKWQISTGGGLYARWRKDGNEIYYLTPDRMLMAATVDTKGSSVKVSAVKPLFQTPASGSVSPYDVSRDGSRFLINTFPKPKSSPSVTVVINWTAGLKK